MRRGEVWWAVLKPRSGSEQRGSRPVIVVTDDIFNEHQSWRSIIVVPLSTSGAQSKRGPTSVPIPTGVGGISRDSSALCHQITTVDRAKLLRRMGTLPLEYLAEVERGLKITLALP